MFKKIFGPKKVEGVGTPVPAEELRDALLDCFPKEGEINQYLTIERSDKTHEGFTAAWEFFIRQSDDEGIKRNYLMTHTVLVDIRPEEKAVYLKNKHFARTKRVPKDTEVYDPWYRQVRIGKLADMKAENIDKVRFFSSKKSLDPVVIQATNMGWDAYR
jgi:ferritin